MIDAWLESVFLKRALLSMCTTAAAYVAAHSLPGLDHLHVIGISITIQIDPAVLSNWLAVFLTGGAHWLLDWASAKWPIVAKAWGYAPAAQMARMASALTDAGHPQP